MEIITSWIRTLVVLISIAKDKELFQRSLMRRRFTKSYVLLIAVFFSFGFQVNLFAQNNIQGVAPLLQPKGGLAVDGNAYVRLPGDDPDAGDWLFENGTDPENADPGGVFPPSASDGIAEGIPDQPYPDDFYLYPDQTTFFRDNITNNDPTIFTSSNKINDDPNTYTWGTGSSPNKNEIQNAIAHFSFADPTIQYGQEGDLWLAFAADRQVTNGSSYIDFEILQAPLTLNNDGTVTSAGPDGGRTVLDLLITIEFTNGGGAASVVVRQWGPDGSGGFIYSIITPETGTVFGTENDVETIVPYSIYNQDPINEAGFYQYSINQWAEGAVNVSSFFPEDACVNLSTLFVRTRTSGSSSQSELKDFPGKPIDIEIDLTPEAPELTDQAACDSWDDTLTAEGCEGTVTWYDQAEGGSVLETGNTYSPGEITETTSFWASCTVNECEGPRAMVTITIYESPDFDVTDLEACEETDTGAQSFDLNDVISNEEEGTLSFYDSEADAIAATGAIGDPTSVSVTLEESPKQFWARLDNDDDGEEDCNTIKSFMVSVYDNPDLMVQDLEDCEDADTEAQTFDLNDAVTDADGGSVSFYGSEADALAESGAIASPESYSAALGTITLWARSDNDEDAEEGCFTIASFDVTVYDNPDLTVQDLEDCEDEDTEAQTFDLNDAVTDADGGSISFYGSEADALAESGAIGSPESYSAALGTTTLWARSDNDADAEEGCFTIASFDVTVYDNPDLMVQDLEDCEDADTEAQTFDLNDAVTDADGGSISFYGSEADALSESGAIASPESYSAALGTTTLWVRSDNDEDAEEGCFSIASFDVSVYDNPDLMVQNLADCEDGITEAQTFDLNDAVTDADGGSLSFYGSEADALAESGAIGSPESYSAALGTTTLWVRSDNDEDGEEGCFSIASFDVTVYDNPDFDVEDLAACQAQDVETAQFDLNDAISNEDAGSLSFYYSEADALVPQNAILDPTMVSVGQEGDTFWARLDNDDDEEENCYTIKSFDVSVYDNPDLMVQDLADCEDGDTGAQIFDLNDGVTDADGGTISFYNSEADAQNASGAIANPMSFSVSIGSDQIWVRSDNESDGDETCFSIESFMINVYDNPDLMVQDLEDCEDGTTGSQTFDLNDGVTDADGGSVTFYNSEADAIAASNSIASPLTYSVDLSSETIWVRSDNDNDGEEGCYTIESFEITVYDNPDLMVQDLSDCEDEDTGAQTFDINGGVTDADGGTLSFYNSEADAINQTAAIGNPLSFSVAIGSDQIWVRSDSTTDEDEDCYTIASFMIYVYDNPDVTATNPDTICNGESVDLSLYVSADGGSLSYHTTQEDADSGLNALGSSIVSPGVGTTSYYVRSETTNGDDICYGTAVIMVTVEECDQEGCTLGYWKNHTDRWCDAYATCDIYGDIFANAPSELADLTLLEVLNIEGGGIYNLGRQSVAALLNTCSSEVDFEYTNVDGLISDVNDAFSGGTAGSFGNYLDMLNMAGCPLGGSVATTEPSDSCPSILAAASNETISGFSVSPVPFRETLNVKYNFEYTSNVNIQIFNINGQMLQNFQFKGVTAGDTNTLELGFTVRPSQAYIIKMNTDRESFSKTIISSE